MNVREIQAQGMENTKTKMNGRMVDKKVDTSRGSIHLERESDTMRLGNMKCESY